MGTNEKIVDGIPPTPVPPIIEPRRVPSPFGVIEYVVPYGVATRQRLVVNADWLMIEWDYPISLVVDGAEVLMHEYLRPESAIGQTNYETDTLSWLTNHPPVAIFQTKRIEIQRPVREIEIWQSPFVDAFDADNREYPGQARVLAGRGGITKIEPGPWHYSSFSRVNQLVGNEVFVTHGPIDFSLHNNTGTGDPAALPVPHGTSLTTKGNQYIPAEVELLDAHVLTESQFPGIERFRIYWRSSDGRQYDLWAGGSPTIAVRYRYTIPNVRVPAWQLRRHILGTSPKLSGVYIEVQFASAHQWSSITTILNYRGR